MISVHKESNEVLYPDEDIVVLAASDIKELKQLVRHNPRNRIRICAHRNPNETLHEMFIIHTQDCYVRPHKHLGKAESMTVLEGEVDVVLFSENGELLDIIHMSEPLLGKTFYYRISDPIYHSLIIRSEYLVFHEVTQGPFVKKDTLFPDWAPDENDHELVNKFLKGVQEK